MICSSHSITSATRSPSLLPSVFLPIPLSVKPSHYHCVTLSLDNRHIRLSSNPSIRLTVHPSIHPSIRSFVRSLRCFSVFRISSVSTFIFLLFFTFHPQYLCLPVAYTSNDSFTIGFHHIHSFFHFLFLFPFSSHPFPFPFSFHSPFPFPLVIITLQ